MKNICNTMGYISLIGGAIGSIVLAIDNGKVAEISYYGVDYERSIPMTIAWLIAGALCTAMTCIVFFALSDILEKLETLEYYRTQSNSAVGLMSDEQLNKKILSEDGWTCKKCGRVNYSYTGTCVCGCSKE